MLNEKQNDKFIILCKEIVPEYILRTESDGFLMGDFRDKEIFSCFLAAISHRGSDFPGEQLRQR